MKEVTIVWAKLFIILVIAAEPLCLNAILSECKHLGNNSCLNDSECCSGYCYKEPGWELGVCKKIKKSEYSGYQDTTSDAMIDTVFERGVCSFYDKQTVMAANGDVYNENDVTAAHRTLPFNTMVKVEVMGSSVVVKINDRKTDENGNILDLSLGAAEAIDIVGKGPTQCQITILDNVGCTPDLGNTCVMHHECCSGFCFREMFSEVGFCTPK